METIISPWGGTGTDMTFDSVKHINKIVLKTIFVTIVIGSWSHIELEAEQSRTDTGECLWMIYDSTGLESMPSIIADNSSPVG